MDVTHSSPTCTLPSNGELGCGCKPAKPAKGSGAAKAAVIVAGTAAACTACCVLPFTLPAIVLANIGGILTVLDHAHGWVTWLAISAVAAVWVWIGHQSIRARVRPATSTVVMMGFATIVMMLAASWPLLKPTAFNTLGIVQKNPDKR
ncbi:hypothetical protein [Afipia sp. GAS231]|uniref:hypothetical protein n=1 Tax=Afipia sp. GAS231 TaxID=1882747 RepID=UPI00087B066E|nr:hypothetical protein [Afipia sp. GAS231]SDN09438.1 hypothetical protein SAMN05444050_0652 [Afipia sp. GAS231]